ncbi:uncharacterized protein [Temnothorax nylanderi]|uniref:uncharacterized protein n=1 Tax=Temnothorax nylanderi TaxID=102681 RepID=UPI003A87BC98
MRSKDLKINRWRAALVFVFSPRTEHGVPRRRGGVRSGGAALPTLPSTGVTCAARLERTGNGARVAPEYHGRETRGSERRSRPGGGIRRRRSNHEIGVVLQRSYISAAAHRIGYFVLTEERGSPIVADCINGSSRRIYESAVRSRRIFGYAN